MLRRLLLTVLLGACASAGDTPVFDAHWIPDARVPDARVVVDAPVPDATPIPDAAVFPDAPVPDARPGAYLDRCTSAGGCASGLCLEDIGGSSFCSKTCTNHAGCASEHVCDGAGHCVPDDTGRPCSTATPATCALGLCVGSGGPAACTRTCAAAADCPAGYGCMSVGGTKVCVDIEKPCSAPTDCTSGLCFGTLGCTSACTTAADCPARFTALGLPAYTCGDVSGTQVCIPPADVVGSLAAGATCQVDGASVLCRSGACDDPPPDGYNICTQTCTAGGGCGPGLGCSPYASGGDILLVCDPAGSKDLGETCAHGYECESGLCDGSGVCTRLCSDGLCPTGWSCDVIAGTSVWICRP